LLALSLALRRYLLSRFFRHPTSATEIYTLSLHDALPISSPDASAAAITPGIAPMISFTSKPAAAICSIPMATSVADFEVERNHRSEEHTSELQSRENLVCRLLLEKKKKKKKK